MFVEVLRAKLAGVCDLTDGQAELLRQHYELLVRWNRTVNLTSIRTMEEIVERHFCESIFAALQLPASAISIGDVGSGGGFPGVPIAIMRPMSSVSLIESHQRKAAFLKEAARGLPNVRVIAKRVEDVVERFDWVVSRAVRYADIARELQRLGGNAELLIGEVRPGELPGFDWRDPEKVPWGDHRYLLIGVSRET